MTTTTTPGRLRTVRDALIPAEWGRFSLMGAVILSAVIVVAGVGLAIAARTATEVLLLAATAAAATEGLPWYAVLALPLLFAGGMTLFDTLDGCFMNFAYGWAFARPVRKVYYNLVITGLSIAVAFLIGTIEIAGLLSAELHIRGGFWDFMANFNINQAGFAIAALFVVVWGAAIGYWNSGTWTPGGRPPPAPRPRPPGRRRRSGRRGHDLVVSLGCPHG